jgi:hypothetical protein
MPPKTAIIFGMLAALLLGGCAMIPSSTIAGTKVPADATVAIFCTPNYPYDGLDLDGSFLGFLHNHGLTATNQPDAPFVLQIGFKLSGPSTVECTLALREGSQTLISVNATNPTTETELPPGRDRDAANRTSAFRAATQKFELKARGGS